MTTATKAPTTYTVMSRRAGSREYRKMAFGFLKQTAVAEVYTLFTSSHSIAQAAIVNERTGKVVGRYEQEYDTRAKCMVVKRVATR